MIDALRILHFKRFAELALALRPLTVLTGVNGSGKSSVLHALLLCRQICLSPWLNADLNGPFGLCLGEVLDVLHRGSDEGCLAVEVQGDGNSAVWQFQSREDRSMTLSVEQRPARVPRCLDLPGRVFTYLTAERLGPRDIQSVSSEGPDLLNVGEAGQFAAQVLSLLDRHVVSPGRLCSGEGGHGSSVGAGAVPDLLHQTEEWLGRVVRPILQTHGTVSVLASALTWMLTILIAAPAVWPLPKRTGSFS